MPPDPRQPDATRRGGTQNDPQLELVRQARAGDTGAFSELVRLQQDAIYGLMLRMIGNQEQAEELTQDVFVRAWRNLDRFREEARVSTWLYRIAINLARDHLGSRQARDRRVETSLSRSEPGIPQIASSSPAPDQQLEDREIASAFQRAIEDLDPQHRAAFLLRHQEGLAPAEIASALEISVANAKVRVHRAREMILETLRQLGHAV